MKFNYPGTNEPIRVGDIVRIRRWLRRDLRGVVDYVYDPSKPSFREVNDPGFSVKIDEKRSIWANEPDENILLVSRAREQGTDTE